jgi:hypothetical protein
VRRPIVSIKAILPQKPILEWIVLSLVALPCAVGAYEACVGVTALLGILGTWWFAGGLTDPKRLVIWGPWYLCGALLAYGLVVTGTLWAMVWTLQGLWWLLRWQKHGAAPELTKP